MAKKVWSDVVSREVRALAEIDEQFSDQELERLYRLARAWVSALNDTLPDWATCLARSLTRAEGV